MEPEEKGVATLERALTILAAFETSTVLPLAEISRRTGLYKSTLLRLLTTLERFGYIGQQSDGLYHVGVAALHLGSLYSRWVTPAELINPVLERLMIDGGESASFSVREGDLRVCVYRVDSTHKIRDHVRIGDVLPLDKGAAGKVLCAFDIELTAPRWAEVRAEYFAHTRGEIEPDTAGVAAPVFDAQGRCKGAVVLTGPAFRFTPERVASMRAPILAAAIEVTRGYGGDITELDAAWRRASKPTPLMQVAQVAYSATMLAFHEPALGVIAPVTKLGNTEGSR